MKLYIYEKVWLQLPLIKLTWLHILQIISLNCMFFYMLFNTYVEFRVNQILFTIQPINLFLLQHFGPQNLKFKYMINNIAIDLWSLWKFEIMEDIRRKCNLIVVLSKFTSKKKYWVEL